MAGGLLTAPDTLPARLPDAAAGTLVSLRTLMIFEGSGKL